VAFFFEILLAAELVLPEASGGADVFFQGNSLGHDLLFFRGLRCIVFLPEAKSRTILADDFDLLLLAELVLLLEHRQHLLFGVLLLIILVGLLKAEEVHLVDGVLLFQF
jgi:hypothetical protein